jgi:hypothetical protein
MRWIVHGVRKKSRFNEVQSDVYRQLSAFKSIKISEDRGFQLSFTDVEASSPFQFIRRYKNPQ